MFNGDYSNVEEFQNTPPEVMEMAQAATSTLIPEKSRKQYELVYKRFNDWCVLKIVKNLTENVFLAYFSERAKHIKPSSLWSEYSMVKALLIAEKDIDLKQFSKLTAYMKRQSVGYHSKKSKVFSKDEIYKFVNEAPNDRYLMMKVVAIFGIAGACRRDEFYKMSVGDVQDIDNMLIVRIPTSKTNKPRTFIIDRKTRDLENMVEIYRKYSTLRSPATKHDRLFVNYRNGKCSVQPIGINTFGKIPSEIARYLGLPNAHEYTGHSFRRSSATMLADAGGDVLQLKRHGGWKSSTVAESYVEESIKNKIEISHQILQKEPSEEASSNDAIDANDILPTTSRSHELPRIHIENCVNCKVEVHIVKN